ncbi:CAP domain-containing protein [Melittangium boletus]|uniref:Membrane protein n=1 Tax=Melittangium boletus DSM 14713 TaxID=1294270 RepID=A0A250IPQ0_9BACT|nr:CAP domain-containing protein [Melittangium boletus]ATB33248.1 membrane protein [Melittangium boletus DSM 14713]
MKRTMRGLSLLLGATLFVGCGGDVSAPESEGLTEEGMRTEEASGVQSLASTQAYCDDVNSWDSSWTNLENQVLSLVNQKRASGASCGGVWKGPTAALTLDTRLRCAARKHSKDLGVTNTFSHTGSNGSSPWQRINSAGYSYMQAAENIAAGQGTAAAVMDSWMKSTGHCNNIMEPGLKHLGVGYFYASGSTYKHYWTQDFGRQ